MKPGSIIVVDWRDAIPASIEVNKQRPGIVVGRSDVFDDEFGFVMVVPLTGERELRILRATVEIPPTPDNGCTKRSYALTWNVQSVLKRRTRATKSHVTESQLEELRDQIARLVER
jgi:mRNA-degrading endonuclease toxin of MazEF toxin-antitoxin module